MLGTQFDHVRVRATLVAVVIALTVLLLSAAPAQAAAPLPMSHVGWVNYSPLGQYECRRGGGDLIGGVVSEPWSSCGYSSAAYGSAYRWTGQAWVAVYLPRGYVYVSPYTGNWRWAWTQTTGWVAVHQVIDPTNATNTFHRIVTGPSR